MNKILLDNIYNTIFKTVSGATKHVHFDYLPDESLLKQVTVVYELRNSQNEQTFDSKESNRFYDLGVKINAPQLNNLPVSSIYNLKDQLYKLPVSYIKLVDEDQFFDPELKVWTNTMSFEVQSN